MFSVGGKKLYLSRKGGSNAMAYFEWDIPSVITKYVNMACTGKSMALDDCLMSTAPIHIYNYSNNSNYCNAKRYPRIMAYKFSYLVCGDIHCSKLI